MMHSPLTKLKVGSVIHLENGGKGLVFSLKLVNHPANMPEIPAFAVRYEGQVLVYKNICGHIAINLDFVEGQFFDEDGEHIVCSTHGALYEASSGKCLGGPCYGVGLEAIEAIVEDDVLYITDQTVADIIK